MARTKPKVSNETEHNFAKDLTPPSAETVTHHEDERTLVNGDMDWRRASDLEAPPPRPGFRQRWIRIALGGNSDARHVMKKFREGWQPRPVDTVPEGYSPPTIQHGQFGACIGVEDMILCEMPEKLARSRDAFVRGQTNRQLEAVERDLRQVERPGNPIIRDVRSTTTFGRVRRGTVADD